MGREQTAMKVLLDSHVVLWWLAESRLVSRRARAAIKDATNLLISPVSFWEITMLAARGKVELRGDPHAWTQALLSQDRIEEAPFTSVVAVSAARLDPTEFPGDPADRFLYATARDLDVAFVTRDRGIRTYAGTKRDVRVIW